MIIGIIGLATSRSCFKNEIYTIGNFTKKEHCFDQAIGSDNTLDVEETVKVPLDQMEFRYEVIAFRHKIEKMKVELNLRWRIGYETGV